MSKITIRISQQINGQDLLNEDGYNVMSSAYAFAEACETEFLAAAEAKYPGAEITIDQDVQVKCSGYRRTTTAMILDAESQKFIADEMEVELDEIERRVFESYSWAVAE